MFLILIHISKGTIESIGDAKDESSPVITMTAGDAEDASHKMRGHD